MRLIVPLHQYEHLDQIISQSDGLFFGHASFGTRLTKHFEIDQINHMIETIRMHRKSSYLMCNQMMDDQKLKSFQTFISQINIEDLNGVVVADIGAMMILLDAGYAQKVIYHPETLNTNHFDFNYFKNEHIQGAFVSKEITLEDILKIGNQKAYQLFMVGHGHLSMFYSKRHLIENYQIYHEIPDDHSNSQRLKLIEEERKDQSYPVLEDLAGTHVFRSDVFTTHLHIDMLQTVVDCLFLDTIFKDDTYTLDILKVYQHQADEQQMMHLTNLYNETWSDGFLFNKTIYKKVQDEQND